MDELTKKIIAMQLAAKKASQIKVPKAITKINEIQFNIAKMQHNPNIFKANELIQNIQPHNIAVNPGYVEALKMSRSLHAELPKYNSTINKLIQSIQHHNIAVYPGYVEALKMSRSLHAVLPKYNSTINKLIQSIQHHNIAVHPGYVEALKMSRSLHAVLPKHNSTINKLIQSIQHQGKKEISIKDLELENIVTEFIYNDDEIIKNDDKTVNLDNKLYTIYDVYNIVKHVLEDSDIFNRTQNIENSIIKIEKILTSKPKYIQKICMSILTLIIIPFLVGIGVTSTCNKFDNESNNANLEVQAQNKTLYVICDVLNVRQDNNTNSKIIYKLKKGDNIKFILELDNWYWIEYLLPGIPPLRKHGWVSKHYVKEF